MINPNFTSKQVVKIENEDQLKAIYHLFRPNQKRMSLETGLTNIHREHSTFPIYLQYAHSSFGSSIEYTKSTENFECNNVNN